MASIKTPLSSAFYNPLKYYFPNHQVLELYYPSNGYYKDVPPKILKELKLIYGDKVIDLSTWMILHMALDRDFCGLKSNLAFIRGSLSDLFYPLCSSPPWPNNCPIVISTYFFGKVRFPVMYWDLSQYDLELIIKPVKKFLWKIAVKAKNNLADTLIADIAQREKSFPNKLAYSCGGFAEENNRYFFDVKGRENIFAFFSALTIL